MWSGLVRLRATVQLSMLKHVSVSETKISLFEGVDYITLVKPARGLYIYVDTLTCVPIYTHARGGRAGRGCPLRGAVQRACTNDQSAATAAWLASARSSSV